MDFDLFTVAEEMVEPDNTSLKLTGDAAPNPGLVV
jgi:hypothetical protein